MSTQRRTTTDPVLAHALQMLDTVEDVLVDIDGDQCDEDHEFEASAALDQLRAAIALIRHKATRTETIVRRDPPSKDTGQ
ncbi:hypothetical protein [Kocuria oceani]|uniref:Uncharacterized protein n=1 Tax=Kocuria oceani TaxID=988827 RepID=A0ABV9TMX5_9MICC|nr:hypothetical protein [Kocuria oceani]